MRKSGVELSLLQAQQQQQPSHSMESLIAMRSFLQMVLDSSGRRRPKLEEGVGGRLRSYRSPWLRCEWDNSVPVPIPAELAF